MHHDARESFYILAGSCRFRVGDDVVDAGPGSFVSIPAGATHGFVPRGGSARALVTFTPAAMEGYWEAVAEAEEAGTLDQARMDELARRHHLEIVGPWPTDGEPAS